MTDYSHLTDQDLLSLAAKGFSEAEETLLSRYSRTVRACARPLFLAGGDSEDLVQEGMIGLFKAIRDYDSGRDASFRTFATLCVSRQLYTFVESSGRKKNLPLNTALSLNAPAGSSEEETGDTDMLQDLLRSGSDTDPEEYLLAKERLQLLEEKIEGQLSAFEKQVLDLHLTGMGYVEIAHVLNKSEKSTDNALQRVRSKVRAAVRSRDV